MTVKIMPGEAALKAPETLRTPAHDLQAETPGTKMPPVVAAAVMGNENHRRRRARGTFGDVLFVQLILSALLAGGIWSGLTFGGDEVREICRDIIALFA